MEVMTNPSRPESPPPEAGIVPSVLQHHTSTGGITPFHPRYYPTHQGNWSKAVRGLADRLLTP